MASPLSYPQNPDTLPVIMCQSTFAAVPAAVDCLAFSGGTVDPSGRTEAEAGLGTTDETDRTDTTRPTDDTKHTDGTGRTDRTDKTLLRLRQRRLVAALRGSVSIVSSVIRITRQPDVTLLPQDAAAAVSARRAVFESQYGMRTPSNLLKVYADGRQWSSGPICRLSEGLGNLRPDFGGQIGPGGDEAGEEGEGWLVCNI